MEGRYACREGFHGVLTVKNVKVGMLEDFFYAKLPSLLLQPCTHTACVRVAIP